MNPEEACVCIRLLVAPTTHCAYIAIAEELYRLPSLAEASSLAAFVPLTLVDGRGERNPLKRARGVAHVFSSEQARPLIRLATDDSEEVIELNANMLEGPFADWVYGAYRDRWISTEAEIEVVDAEQIMFDLYLPKRPEPGKLVSFDWDGGYTSVDLGRGKIVCAPIRLGDGRKRIRISTNSAEPPSGSSETRLLGVLISAITLDGSRVTPWLHAGVNRLDVRHRSITAV